MSAKTAQTDHPMAAFLAERWSPRAFADRPVDRETVLSMFEAARWAPSAGNGQPWFFVLGLKGTDGHARIAECLTPGNAWAKLAPVLAISVARLERSGKPNRHAYYELGMAVMNLTYQAQALGVYVHQMAGFDQIKVQRALGIPERHDAVTAIALGYLGDPETLNEDQRAKEIAVRTRKPLEEFLFEGAWGLRLLGTGPE